MEQIVISTTNLTFSYSPKEEFIKDLSLSVKSGSIFGFLGENGAGKTTTIRLLLDLFKPQSGDISLFDSSYQQDREGIHKRIGALIESPSLYEHLTAYKNLQITCNYRNIRKERIDTVLEMVELKDAAHKKVKKFSMGMKQRLGLALALLSDPELLILDEPINGLDPAGIIHIRKIIKNLNEEHGKTIFLSSHLLSEVENTCTHVGILSKGNMVFQGTLAELKQTKSGSFIFSLEVNDVARAQEVLKDKFPVDSISGSNIIIHLEQKQLICEINDFLRHHDILIYQIKIMNENVENLFLKLTAGHENG